MPTENPHHFLGACSGVSVQGKKWWIAFHLQLLGKRETSLRGGWAKHAPLENPHPPVWATLTKTRRARRKIKNQLRATTWCRAENFNERKTHKTHRCRADTANLCFIVMQPYVQGNSIITLHHLAYATLYHRAIRPTRCGPVHIPLIHITCDELTTAQTPPHRPQHLASSLQPWITSESENSNSTSNWLFFEFFFVPKNKRYSYKCLLYIMKI